MLEYVVNELALYFMKYGFCLKNNGILKEFSFRAQIILHLSDMLSLPQ